MNEMSEAAATLLAEAVAELEAATNALLGQSHYSPRDRIPLDVAQGVAKELSSLASAPEPVDLRGLVTAASLGTLALQLLREWASEAKAAEGQWHRGVSWELTHRTTALLRVADTMTSAELPGSTDER